MARRILQENGFKTDPPEASVQAPTTSPTLLDLTHLPWSSIDNAESQDLDQIEFAEKLPDGTTRVLVGIADVEVFVTPGSAVDVFAAANTTTIYAGVGIFPMLPESLSTHQSSLLADGHPRLAVITEMVVDAQGVLQEDKTQVYAARVLNQAKLAYEAIGEWLEGRGDAGLSAEIAAQVRLQDEVASLLRQRRHERGALELETVEAQPVARDGQVVQLELVRKNRARDLIEDLMIAANGATARFLELRGRSSLRRVVEKPKRWDRIVELAVGLGVSLPVEPNSKALSDFLVARRKAQPETFAQLCLSVVKLLGPGTYVLQRADQPDVGHFSLAMDDYARSTAPNRRYADLICQRLLKTAAHDLPSPHSDDELSQIAAHCTERENAARKVERTLRKVAAADFLSRRINETFDATVTGVGDKGVFVRLDSPPAEGRVVRNERGLDVGQHLRVRLLSTDVDKGFIDFAAL